MDAHDFTLVGTILQAVASVLYIPIWRALTKIRLDLAEGYVKKADHKEAIEKVGEDMDKMENRIMSNSRIRVIRARP